MPIAEKGNMLLLYDRKRNEKIILISRSAVYILIEILTTIAIKYSLTARKTLIGKLKKL
jgi:hypothetical protein